MTLFAANFGPAVLRTNSPPPALFPGILNRDFSVNTAANPVDKGGLVPGICDLSIRIPPNTRSGVAPPRPASPSMSANNLPEELFPSDLAPF